MSDEKQAPKNLSVPSEPMVCEPSLQKECCSATSTFQTTIQLTDPKRAYVPKSIIPDDFPLPHLAEHPLNILTIPSEYRSSLLLGPKISIIADRNIPIRTKVPVRALMAACGKVHDLILIKPRVAQFRIYGKVDHESVNKLLDVFTTTAILEASEKIDLATGDLKKDILLYQACLALGVYYIHAKSLLNIIRAEISSRVLTYDEMNAIVYSVPSNDPLFKHLANALCHRRFKKEIEDIKAFERWLGKDGKKKLQAEMRSIDQAHKKRRCEIREKAGESVTHRERKVGVVMEQFAKFCERRISV